MGNTFVPDLGVYLDDVHLNLWNTSEIHRSHWMQNPPPDFGSSNEPSTATTVVVASYRDNKRYGRRCLHLAERTEEIHGCTGWRCLHACRQGLPAVPGEFCQSCERFEDGGDF